MKKISILFLLVFTTFIFAQDQLKDAKSTPLFLVDNTIAGYDFFKNISPEHIESVDVYNSRGSQKLLTDFAAHLKVGIINLKLKKYQEQFTRVSLSKLNEMHQLAANASVYVDGFLVKNNNVEIFDDAIEAIQMTHNDTEEVLNIITSSKKRADGLRILPNNEKKESKRPVYLKQIK